VKGLALAVVGLWVVLQTTYGPLATKLGLITSSTPPNSAAPPQVRGPAGAAGGGPSQGPGGTNTGNT
jgi:hypothetical protein